MGKTDEHPEYAHNQCVRIDRLMHLGDAYVDFLLCRALCRLTSRPRIYAARESLALALGGFEQRGWSQWTGASVDPAPTSSHSLGRTDHIGETRHVVPFDRIRKHIDVRLVGQEFGQHPRVGQRSGMACILASLVVRCMLPLPSASMVFLDGKTALVSRAREQPVCQRILQGADPLIAAGEAVHCATLPLVEAGSPYRSLMKSVARGGAFPKALALHVLPYEYGRPEDSPMARVRNDLKLESQTHSS